MKKLLLALTLALTATQTHAAEMRVITSGAMQGVLRVLAGEFTAANGHEIEIVSRPVFGVQELVNSGAPADVIMTSDVAMESFLSAGALRAETLTRIGFIGIGVAVRAGAPQPDISSAADFRNAMLEAQSVVFMNPDAGVSSAVALRQIFDDLGISDAIAAKALILDEGLAAPSVANGNAEIALQNMTQLVGVEGIDIVGPLPPDIQIQTGYKAAVAANSEHADAAAQLIAYLTRPEAMALWVKAGFEPPAR